MHLGLRFPACVMHRVGMVKPLSLRHLCCKNMKPRTSLSTKTQKAPTSSTTTKLQAFLRDRNYEYFK